uniref:NADH-ubiquinone oxidoreductase chain 4 n=1 Tax=Plethodon shenandoah TaxID=141978 RepID=A0A4Y5P4D7_9SALA|nr:NADH dehydrogenase subunit 4 [Plethodon shenandoah]QCW57870.1 NADH dehydrogenase subunit 4 [Plethodon shenandoah]QCW58039.1 NADH dehydrogenase subunit 4 [Plethodon shenandoah]QCW58052.1 NADH dehydrogenase subunit 4 [Plethodon shenandoah]QCW58065.1 NADH dehydrogenase subunit 4 [Plethodon shenandoah]
MLKILIPTMMMIPMIWLSPPQWLWFYTTISSLTIASTSLTFLLIPLETMMMINKYMGLDQISSPLLTLTCWLLPMMILASQHHLKDNPFNRQQAYISMLTILQVTLIMAFSSTELILFYIAFETTLIPTLIIITRWGNQTERLNAGTYFLFYTLAGSLPLLIALLFLYNSANSLSINFMYTSPQTTNKILWLGCLTAFLIKMPLYGTHLWLPKAHVEAPVAGSMILAAVLLKLGGYGLIRIMFMFPSSTELSYPFIIMALWGILMTSLICIRQTDLKSLIAYSSVSHMGLVVAATLIQTPWSLTGAVILMISHGMVSSALFCLANMNYERTHSRTMLLTRGLQATIPLMATWWLLLNLFNMALPPTPNLLGELMIMTALFNWSPWTIIITGLGTILTATYTLHMFLMTQQGQLPKHLKCISPTFTREHCLLMMHLLPMILLMMKPELLS